MFEIRNLTKKFKNKIVLSDISLSLENGVYGLLGANGAGKTTLLRCITQLYPECSSSVFYNNKGIADSPEILNRIGYLPQEFDFLKDLTVFESMMLLSNLKGVQKKKAINDIENVLQLVNLVEDKHKKVRYLSGGMLRRLGIAQALLNEPKIVIFDEPTSGLDPIERLRFKSIVSKIEKDRIVIISTHIVEDIEAVCDKVIIIDEGKIKFCSSCDELIQKAYGKVYECPEKNIIDISGKYYIVKLYMCNNNTMARVITAEKQILSQCGPTIEDGYLCIIEKI